MLDYRNKDTDAVRAWLQAALAPGNPRAVKPAALAAHCQVSPQAVTGWKVTGRISKTHLAHAIAFLGSAPHFPGVAATPQESGALGWPFPALRRHRFDRLPPAEKAKIEAYALFTISQWEADSNSHTHAQGAAAA